MGNISKFNKNTLQRLIACGFIGAASTIAIADQPNTAISPNANIPSHNADTNHAHFCPFAKELTKRGLRWRVGNSWKSDTESFVKDIGGFVGAQWKGIKYGTIICLYQGKENIDFPISIQPIYSTLVLDPTGSQWSGLIKTHKLCKSSNVYDCPFFVKPAENIKDIYKQIEYKGSHETGVLNEPQY